MKRYRVELKDGHGRVFHSGEFEAASDSAAAQAGAESAGLHDVRWIGPAIYGLAGGSSHLGRYIGKRRVRDALVTVTPLP